MGEFTPEQIADLSQRIPEAPEKVQNTELEQEVQDKIGEINEILDIPEFAQLNGPDVLTAVVKVNELTSLNEELKEDEINNVKERVGNELGNLGFEADQVFKDVDDLEQVISSVNSAIIENNKERAEELFQDVENKMGEFKKSYPELVQSQRFYSLPKEPCLLFEKIRELEKQINAME